MGTKMGIRICSMFALTAGKLQEGPNDPFGQGMGVLLPVVSP